MDFVGQAFPLFNQTHDDLDFFINVLNAIVIGKVALDQINILCDEGFGRIPQRLRRDDDFNTHVCGLFEIGRSIV